MTATTQLNPLIGKLTQKTEAKELNWSAIENGVELEMSDLVVRVTKQHEDGRSGFVLELLTEDGVPIESFAEPNNGVTGVHSLSRLYDLAHDRIRTTAIDKLLSALNEPSKPHPAPKYVLPSSPTEEDQRAVFTALQGRWLLADTRGQEVATIYEEGEYSVYDQVRRKPGAKFQLRLIAINRAGKKIELAKDTLDGKRLQIEVLHLNDMDRPTSMDGEAKYDQQKLVYTRLS